MCMTDNKRGSSGMILVCLLLIVVVIDVSGAFSAPKIPSSPILRSLRRAHNLNTAFEWLADDRENEQMSYSCLTWLDAAVGQARSGDVDESPEADTTTEMPIYPIGATYLPSGTTHFLNNMEPRNVQMAIDLSRLPVDHPKLFCAVLSASDTGRIANVGTVLQVVDMDVQRIDGDIMAIDKIRVTCRPEATVDIVSIVNPQAASWESRIRKSPEYLKANVRYRRQSDATTDDGGAVNDELVMSILGGYNAIRELYLDGVGTRHLPPFAVKNLKEALSEWTVDSFQAEDETFWASLEQWQTLCNTVRESQQMRLSTDRNEIMVAAAAAKGGPLKLPIHEADLQPEVRRQLQDMEVRAQQNFVEMGMDPCLDFQVLLSLPNYTEKLQFLSTMIGREHQRLESLQEDAMLAEDPIDVPEQPKRGAWFDDAAWEFTSARRHEESIEEEVREESLSFNSTQHK